MATRHTTWMLGLAPLASLVLAGPAAAAPVQAYDPGASGTIVNIRGQGLAGGFFTPTELAGNPLGAYPHFEYVLAINEGSPVTFALDPTRFPASAGQTVDLYVVAARSDREWLEDVSLTDVRGGPQTVTLGSTDLQSSTFVLTGTDLLSGDAGLGLGVPYDVVCDTNQSGALDSGDYIDGFGEVAGFYVVHDVTTFGPLSVIETNYSVQSGSVTAGFENENLFYPSNVTTMGRLPLIVVSHGNGHNYTWYDHIGMHLASYGYIVMSHQNNTVPGVLSAADTTLEHTDAFLGQLGTIVGGILDGHVDTDRIVWMGHSRGGEGIAIAYDRLFDGTWVPQNYDIDDIILLSSIAPVDFQGPANTHPHSVAYSLWTGGADSDVNGCAQNSIAQTFPIHDRAQRWRQSIALHGVGHGDFHNGTGGAFATGPCLVGRANTHAIMRGYVLPLVKHYVESNVPARDFLWRQWEQFKPIGAPNSSCVNVQLQFREDPSQNFVVDDYQTQASTTTSSSGGAVTFNVSSVSEGLLNDNNTTFTHTVSDVMNGMTAARPNDTSSGVVFEWSNDAFYELEIVAGERDLTDDEYLVLRACQATRHPNTTADTGDLAFTVTLVDGSAVASSIRIDAYGGGLEEPYQRTGCGTGAGWYNDFETIRIRLEDFLTNGSALDLSDVAAVRLEFGPSFGAGTGRIGLDEVAISSNPVQPFFGGILIDPDEVDVIAAGAASNIKVRITVSGETITPGSPTLHYRFDNGTFNSVPLTPIGTTGLYAVILPAPACGDVPQLWFSVEGSVSGLVTAPPDAPTMVYQAAVGTLQTTFFDDFESDLGWTTTVLGATTGAWERGVPVDDPGWPHDPATDGDGSGSCYLTGNALGDTDIDGGTVRLTSPTLDVASERVIISYDYYLNLGGGGGGNDRIIVEYNGNDGSGIWNLVAEHDLDGGLAWQSHEITGDDIVAVGGTLTSTARIRFVASDALPDSIVEAGIDGFTVKTLVCE